MIWLFSWNKKTGNWKRVSISQPYNWCKSFSYATLIKPVIEQQLDNLGGVPNNDAELQEAHKHLADLEELLAQEQRNAQERVEELELRLAREQAAAQDKLRALEQQFADERKKHDLLAQSLRDTSMCTPLPFQIQ